MGVDWAGILAGIEPWLRFLGTVGTLLVAWAAWSGQRKLATQMKRQDEHNKALLDRDAEARRISMLPVLTFVAGTDRFDICSRGLGPAVVTDWFFIRPDGGIEEVSSTSDLVDLMVEYVPELRELLGDLWFMVHRAPLPPQSEPHSIASSRSGAALDITPLAAALLEGRFVIVVRYSSVQMEDRYYAATQRRGLSEPVATALRNLASGASPHPLRHDWRLGDDLADARGNDGRV